MRVRCKAAADFRGNAAGHLELEDTPGGLSIAYVAVSLHREGYAPGPITRGTRVCVPWRSVYATRSGDEILLLSVDARFTPLNRFVLCAFSTGQPPPASEVARRRRIVRVAASAALLLGVTLVSLAAPELIGSAGFSALGLAGGAALLMLLFGVGVEPRASSALSARVVLDQFCQALSRHLPQQVGVEVPVAPGKRVSVGDVQAALPRSAVGIAITLSATGLAALITSVSTRPGVETAALREEPQTRRELPSAIPTSRATPAAQSSIGHAGPDSHEILMGAPCSCERQDSLLWQHPMPRLSPIILSQRVRPHGRHQHIELELAAINNGDRSLEKLNIAVTFHEPGTAGERQMSERPLYYEGPLGPGRAIKWQVEGRGTRFDVLAPDLGTLDDGGSDAAPAAAFAALTDANHRAVRLHASMMLAFLGDPRGRAAALELRADAREDESAYLERVIDATRDLITCQVEIIPLGEERHRVQGCIFNRGSSAVAEMALRLRALSRGLPAQSPLGGPPALLADDVQRVPGSIEPRDGRRISWVATLSDQSGLEMRAFEVSADRAELLQ